MQASFNVIYLSAVCKTAVTPVSLSDCAISSIQDMPFKVAEIREL
jgi:hypothetical protein